MAAADPVAQEWAGEAPPETDNRGEAGKEGEDGKKDDAEKKRRKSQATLLVELAQEDDAEFFAFNDEPYVTFKIGDHRETARLHSPAVRRWLQRKYWEKFESAPGSQAIADALATLEGLAMFSGKTHPVHIRVAPDGTGGIWIDLGDPSWSAVHITAGRWSVEPDAPVRFIRPGGLAPLPVPQHGGNLEELRTLWTLTDAQYRLLATYKLQALRPDGPYAALGIDGAQGSGKTVLVMSVKRLIDPNVAPLRSAPHDEVDLVIAAMSSHDPAFDNLSSLSIDMSDALCRMTTGSGIGKRELYSNFRESIAFVCRPFMTNGIVPVAVRSDLIDRQIRITLPPIPEEKRLTATEYWTRWTEREPYILGALYSAMAAVLEILPGMERPAKLPRLAEVALIGIAAEKALGWPAGSFTEAMNENIKAGDAEALDSSPIPAALVGAVATEWRGTASELHALLALKATEGEQRQRGWPANGQALSRALRRLQPNLERSGWHIEVDEKTRPKTIRLTRGNCDNASKRDETASGSLFSPDAIPADSVATSPDCDNAETAPGVDAAATSRNDAILTDLSNLSDEELHTSALHLVEVIDGTPPRPDLLPKMERMQAEMSRRNGGSNG